jgi:hypothetical protein
MMLIVTAFLSNGSRPGEKSGKLDGEFILKLHRSCLIPEQNWYQLSREYW